MDSQFLIDLQHILAADTLSPTEKLSNINILVSYKNSLHSTISSASEIYNKQRSDILSSLDSNKLQLPTNNQIACDNLPDSRSPSRSGPLKLENFPNDLLLVIARHLDGPSMSRFGGVCRRFNILLSHYEQSLWREKVLQRWKFNDVISQDDIIDKISIDDNNNDDNDIETDSVVIRRERSMSIASIRLGYPNWNRINEDEVPWKRVYEEKYNLYTGQYQFHIVTDMGELDNRAKRQQLVQARKGKYSGKKRKYVLHCGQPTTAGSGYAVSLRLCGRWLCWISGDTLAVCEVDGHISTRLKGHTAMLICLAVNHRNLCVTGGEDGTMRLWNLDVLRCEKIFYVDILDVAIHEETIVSYNNDNVVAVWDARLRQQVRVIDLKEMPEVDQLMLNKEVKIALWGNTIVCGFENVYFLVLSRNGSYITTLSEPAHHRREELDSVQYPTVLALYDNILVSRGCRCYEMCIWDVHEGVLLYRLSESISFQRSAGGYIRPNEVITDFTMDSSGGFLMCTVENESTEVYLLAWDFRTLSATPRNFEKRSLENIPGEADFDYTNFWLCYEGDSIRTEDKQ
ncbi:hypothetical protein HK098_007465 [Nowakowskiella sp. JEL0407]|nr:hypothetical protein HK098_007465 [Nowakowskiella sp. JEL0407]